MYVNVIMEVGWWLVNLAMNGVEVAVNAVVNVEVVNVHQSAHPDGCRNDINPEIIDPPRPVISAAVVVVVLLAAAGPIGR
jgi:hypothetical protein